MVPPASFLFKAEVHVDHRVFAVTTVDLAEYATAYTSHTLSSIFNHDFIEWGGTYFKTMGKSSSNPVGKLVIDTKMQRQLRREIQIFVRK